MRKTETQISFPVFFHLEMTEYTSRLFSVMGVINALKINAVRMRELEENRNDKKKSKEKNKD